VQVIWVNSWFDPAKEGAAANSLMDNGADVVTITTDSAAATQAAQKRGKYAIGNDSDMTLYGSKAHLTANIYNWGVYYEYVYKQVKEGTWKPAEDWWGIETGVVDISPYGKMVPDDVRQKVDAMKAAMQAKAFIVFKGPLSKQDGSVAAKPDQMLTDKEMLSMDYFIEGVTGSIPK